MSKTQEIRHGFMLENPENGEAFDFEMDAEETYIPAVWYGKNGDPGEPSTSSRKIIDWWEATTHEKPSWVSQKMLEQELESIEFDD